MIECTCNAPDLEFTVAKDEKSGWILLQACCNNCGNCASGYGRTVQQALMEARREWKKNTRHHRGK
ncbi:MAG: hypothetical protein J6U54_10980 [Clostridiales bacterium]|nr:hypothetical protein [Clostridiales bacterium]